MVCGDGHPSSKIATLGWNPEDIWMGTTLQEFIDGVERLVDKKGATVSTGGRLLNSGKFTPNAKDRVREVKPDGNTKVRLRCEQCGRDVPISWDTLNVVAATLYEHDMTRVELAHLEAMLKSNSRKAGPL
jgi:hypothetical protein